MLLRAIFAPRARRIYYMLGTILALVVAVAVGIFAFFAFARSAFLAAAVAVLVVLVAIAFVVLAHRRTKALVDEEARERHTRANAAFEQWRRQGRATFVAHIRPRAYVLGAVAALVFIGGISMGVTAGSWFFIAICGLGALAILLTIIRFLRNHDALEIGPLGIDDRLGFGLIKWADIRGAALHEDETRGVRTAELMLEVDEHVDWKKRLAPVARLVGPSKWRDGMLILALQVLDQPPRTILSVMRGQHEQVAKRGTLVGTETSYRIDETWAKEQALHDRALAMYKTLVDETKRAQEDPRFASDPARQAALEAKVEASMKEIERVHGEAMKLGKVRIDELQVNAEKARKRFRRAMAILAVGITVVIALNVLRFFVK